MSRTNSRASQLGRDTNRNKSNSNGPAINRQPSSENLKKKPMVQKPAAGLRILGQDREVTEDELWDLNKGKVTPTPNSSRSNASSRPDSGASRGTPSRQVTLQAVKRKEEIDDPIEPIDWKEFNRAVSLNDDRPAAESESGSEDELRSPCERVLSPEERQALVEERARELTSALDSLCLDEAESGLAKTLEQIERERELKEQLEKEREEQLMSARVMSDNDPKYRNDHYINLSARDEKNRISSSFILDDKDVAVSSVKADEIGKDSSTKAKKRTGENVIGKHAMDKPRETAVAEPAGPSSTQGQEFDAFITEVKAESGKKNEASAKGDSSSDDDSDDDDDEDDVIGHRGKAPNQLLMEFVTCLMEEDYENAEKLCKMVLIYEPNNKEALTFYPLIKEKREQEAAEGDPGEEESDSGEEEEEEDGDSDDDSDDDDDDDDDDDESSSEEDSDEQVHPDSGIASANSD